MANEQRNMELMPCKRHTGPAAVRSRAALEVVGVTADVNELGVEAEPPATFYLPAGPQRTLDMLVRTSRAPLGLVGPIRQALREVNPDISISQATTMRARLSATMRQPVFRATVVGVFALVSLLLSAVGLYGVLAFLVRGRRREIGVRLALGAGTGAVRRLVLTQGIALVFWGCAVGLAIGLAGARLIASRGWLFRVGTADPVSLTGVILCLVLVALAACLLPADRAARVDPAEVMRTE